LTPKPRKPQLEKLTPDEQLERDKVSQASHHWLPGENIYQNNQTNSLLEVFVQRCVNYKARESFVVGKIDAFIRVTS